MNKPRGRHKKEPILTRRSVLQAGLTSGAIAMGWVAVDKLAPHDTAVDITTAPASMDYTSQDQHELMALRKQPHTLPTQAPSPSSKPTTTASRAPVVSRSTTRAPLHTATPSRSNTSLKRQQILDTAVSLFGIPYVYGGNTLRGLDCSSYTQTVFKKNGLYLPRTSQTQFSYCEEITHPQPGDLVFMGSGGPHHVGIYSRPGHFYNAQKRGTVTQETPIWSGETVRFGRHPKL